MPDTEKKTENLKDYPAFLSSLELYSIALTRSSFRIRRDEYLKVDETSNRYALSSEVLKLGQEHFSMRCALKLRIYKSPGDIKVPLIALYAVFDLHFHASPITPEFVEQLSQSEIRLIVWPYFREYVSNVSGRMHIPPLILPMKNQSP
jgi:hypothetical protein